MKPKSIKSLLALALLAPGALFAQTTAKTTPVGYVTEVLTAGQDNFMGLTMHSPTIAAGVLTAEAVDKVTTSGVNFTTLLAANATYILELPDGTIQEVTSWTATELLTPQDVTAVVVPNTTTYKLRKAKSIKDVFGVTNTAGLKPSVDGGTTDADLILVPNGLGGFDTYFYYNDGVDQLWANTDLEDKGDTALIYTDGMIVRRRAGSVINLVVDGEVKKDPTKLVVIPGDNIVGSVYPVGVTLANTTFSTQVIPSTDGSTGNADNILLPDGAGFLTFIYYNDGVDALWANTDLENKDLQPLTSGYIFRSRSVVNKQLNHVAPGPNYYSNL
jgi:hypothetical protein